MAATDSIALFTEGTFEEQIQELVNYTLRSFSDEERAASIRPFQEAMKAPEGSKLTDDQKRKVVLLVLEQVKGLGEGSDKEIEGFFNLLYAHAFSLFPSGSPELEQPVAALLERITSGPAEQLAVKYRVLTNLFNALPRTSPLRSTVYSSLLQLAVTNHDLPALQLNQEAVETWLAEWNISSEQKSAFLKSLVDAYTANDDAQAAFNYRLVYTRSLPASSEEANAAAVETISTALRSTTIFDFDTVFKLDAVVALGDHELLSLLQIFLNNGLPEYQAWESSHAGAVEKYNLDKTELERKIRLLTLTSLGFQHVGQNIPYSKIAEVLQVDVSEVEQWVIDVIRTGLLSGKLSQTAETLHVTRASARSFEKEQWEALEKRLLVWKAGLAGVLEVVAGARGQTAVAA